MAARKKAKGSKVQVRRRNPDRSKLMEQAIRDRGDGYNDTSNVRMWKERAHRGIRDNRPYYQDVKRNLVFYVGNQMKRESTGSEAEWEMVMKMMEGGDFLQVNRILSSLAAQNSSLLWKNPWHKLNIRKVLANAQDAEALRNITEATLNYALQSPKNHWLKKARLSVLSAHFGLSWLKAVHVPDSGGDYVIPTSELKYGSVVMAGQAGDLPIYLDGPPKLDDQGNPVLRSGGRYVVETRDPGDYWRTEWVNPLHMVTDPEGGNIFNEETHQWVLQRQCWRWSRFKNIPLFEDVVDDIRPVVRWLNDDSNYNPVYGDILKAVDDDMEMALEGGSDVGQESDTLPEDEDKMRVWGWQCFDIDRQRIEFTIDGYHKLAASEPYPDYMDVSPYSIIKLHEIPGTLEPISEVSQVRGLQRAYNFVQTLKLRHVQRFTRWYMAREGMFDTRNESRIMDKEDGRVVYYKGGYSPSEMVPVKDAPLGSDHYMLGSEVARDMDQTLGSSEPRRGTSTGDTATEAMMASKGIAGREYDKRSVIKEGFEDHAGKYLAMMQRTPELDNSMLVQIVGPDALSYQGKSGRAYIQGRYSVNIELEELEPADSDTERREFREIAATFGPIVLASRAFTSRFFRTHRTFSEDLVRELTEVGQQHLQSQMAQNADGGNKIDGTGPDGGRTTMARSAGRATRSG
jgi:hypothetical protein